jgi:hypothetical protein
MQRNNNGAPFGRGFWPRSMFDGFFEDPFFSDPFIQRGGSFFQSPFSSAFHSAPFGGLLEEFLYGRRGGMRTMQGDFPFHARGQVHQVRFQARIFIVLKVLFGPLFHQMVVERRRAHTAISVAPLA